jgi:hypothetical protein
MTRIEYTERWIMRRPKVAEFSSLLELWEAIRETRLRGNSAEGAGLVKGQSTFLELTARMIREGKLVIGETVEIVRNPELWKVEKVEDPRSPRTFRAPDLASIGEAPR